MSMRKTLQRFLTDESGAAAIEYGLIAGLVAIAAIVGMNALGANLQTLFTNVAGSVGAAP
jgi:pilus assembly protein Flp/PilA